MEKLRYGIIGTGGISPKHLEGYKALSDQVEMVAACDLDEEKLKRTAEKYNIPDTYTDYHELLARKDIDFVSICLPNYLHRPVTVEALNSNKHVHCEKPMAIIKADADFMLETAKKNNKRLMIGLNNRFTPMSQFVKQYIEEGKLGEIYFVKCGWKRRNGLAHAGWFMDKELSGGGPLIDLGVHYIDLAMHFLGFPQVDTVLAKTYTKFGNNEKRAAYTHPYCIPDMSWDFTVEDLATGLITMKNGASVQFEVSWASNIEKETVFYDLYGTEGGVHFEDSFDENGPTLKLFHCFDKQMITCEPKINEKIYKEGEFSHFVRCIREGTDPTISVTEQAADIIQLIEAIYRSAETGKAIQL